METLRFQLVSRLRGILYILCAINISMCTFQGLDRTISCPLNYYRAILNRRINALRIKDISVIGIKDYY